MRDIDDRLSRGGAAVRRMAEEIPIGTPDRITHRRVGGSRRRVGMIVTASLAMVAAITATVVFLDPNQAGDAGSSGPPVGLSDTDLRVFLPVGTTDDQLAHAVTLALMWPGVTDAQGFDSAAALEEFGELFAGCPELVEVASQDVSAFPPSVGLWVEEGTDIEVLSATARTALAAFGRVNVSVTEHAPPVDCSYPPLDELGTTTVPGITVLTPVRIECTAELSDFPCTALIDGDPTTTWQAPDGGIGVTITFWFEEPVQIRDLALANIPGDAYMRNGRVRGLVVTPDDLSQPITLELDDTNEPQVIDIQSLRTSTLEVQITSGYPGQSVGDQAPFTDLALGEITFSGRVAPDPVTPGTTPPTTEAAASGNWVGAGQLVSDEELLALRPGLEPIPGTTVIRLAWTSAYNDQYDLGLFAYMSTTPDPSDDAGIWYCLFEGASLSGSDPRQPVAGGGQCTPTLEEFHEMLAFGVGMGGSCVEPLTWVTTVWGIPELVETVVFHMSDGTDLVGEVANGIAQVAWGSDIVVTNATFAGITEEQTAKLHEIYDYAQSCADLNDPGGGGG